MITTAESLNSGFLSLMLKAEGKPLWFSGVRVEIKIWLPALLVREFNQYRGKIRQTRGVQPLCDAHNISVFCFWQKKRKKKNIFVSSRFQISRSFNSRTFPFSHRSLSHKSYNSTTTRRERGSGRSSLPPVNISLCEHMVYTVKLVSCKCHKLSSQNVHATVQCSVFRWDTVI